MSWPTGWSWTEGGYKKVNNPDGSKIWMCIHSGLFYFNPTAFSGRVFFYIGFRPTPPWGPGFGDEGLLAPIARWLKRKGWGNLGIALRLNKEKK